MTPKSMIFRAPVVRAILRGHKTQLRRVVKPQPMDYSDQHYHGVLADYMISTTKFKDLPWRRSGLRRKSMWINEEHEVFDFIRTHLKCHLGGFGDLFYVKEVWAYDVDGALVYREAGHTPVGRWLMPSCMHAEHARLWLRITDLRVERVQGTSPQDMSAEGYYGIGPDGEPDDPTPAFREAWDERYMTKGYSWNINPWVWVVCFERVDIEEVLRG